MEENCNLRRISSSPGIETREKMLVFRGLTFFAAYLGFLFSAFSLACGMFYLAEVSYLIAAFTIYFRFYASGFFLKSWQRSIPPSPNEF